MTSLKFEIAPLSEMPMSPRGFIASYSRIESTNKGRKSRAFCFTKTVCRDRHPCWLNAQASWVTNLAASALGVLTKPIDSLWPCGMNLWCGEMRCWISAMVVSDPIAMTVFAELKISSLRSAVIVTNCDKVSGSFSTHVFSSGSPLDGNFTKFLAPTSNPRRRLCKPACGVLPLRMCKIGPLASALVVLENLPLVW